MFKDFSRRLKALEAMQDTLVSTAHLDKRLDEITEERRWMHQENSDRFEALTQRLDRFLDR